MTSRITYKPTIGNRLWIAHVDNPQAQPLQFHLNIPVGEKIPRIGETVFASSNNGRSGERRVITQIVSIERFSGCWDIGPFVSVDYASE